MKILVTGSSGTIGTRLCEKLIDANHEVFGIDKVENKWNDKVNDRTILSNLLDTTRLDKEFSLKSFKAFKNIDVCVALAANARVYDLVVVPQLAMDNITILFNTLELCRKANIKNIIFASSREAYGNSEKIINHESDLSVDTCESVYAASKIAGEALVRAYQKNYGISFIVIRYSNVYGMYDDSDRVIPLWITRCASKKSIKVFGKNKLLDFTYINDAVRGTIQCINVVGAEVHPGNNNVFNIASGVGTKLYDVAEKIRLHFLEKHRTIMNIDIKDSRNGEVIRHISNIYKAKDLLHYEPYISFEVGLQKTIEWYEENLLK